MGKKKIKTLIFPQNKCLIDCCKVSPYTGGGGHDLFKGVSTLQQSFHQMIPEERRFAKIVVSLSAWLLSTFLHVHVRVSGTKLSKF